MHGIVMIFLFLIPSIPSVLGNFRLIGARGLAFPRRIFELHTLSSAAY
jgi:cytochrome c oxidase subunit 1